jgi:hypothetical protein
VVVDHRDLSVIDPNLEVPGRHGRLIKADFVVLAPADNVSSLREANAQAGHRAREYDEVDDGTPRWRRTGRGARRDRDAVPLPKTTLAETLVARQPRAKAFAVQRERPARLTCRNSEISCDLVDDLAESPLGSRLNRDVVCAPRTALRDQPQLHVKSV